jgi:hypothetical protein
MMTRRILAALVLVSCAGCATMVNGRNEEVPVDSYPSGAKVAVDCGEVPRDGGATPSRVILARIATECRVTLTKDGYEPKVVTFHREESRAVAANRIAGAPVGFIGAVVGFLFGSNYGVEEELGSAGWAGGVAAGSAPGNQIDKHTGGAYKQVPGEVFVTLVRMSSDSAQ